MRSVDYACAHSPDNNAACSNTVCVALSCSSYGYPYLRKLLFTNTRS